MPFIIAVVTALGAFASWYFRLRAVSQVAGEVIDQAQRARGAFRRKRFRAKAESSPISAVDDPAVAATALLVALASAEGPLDEKAAGVIKGEMRSVMGLQEVEETFTFARWVAGHANDPDDLSLKFAKLWLARLDLAQRADLFHKAQRIAEIAGPPSTSRQASLIRLKDRLGLTRA